MKSRESRHVSCLETVSRHGFSCLGLGSVSTLVCLVVAQVLNFHVSSCLMFHNCVLHVSLLDIASDYSALKHWHFLLKVGL